MKLIYLFWLFIISLNSYSQALIPNPPQLSATSYLLLDAKTLKIISEDNSSQSTGLASITKIMTAYVVADQINKGFLRNDSLVKISEKCWRTEGSRMFVKEGTEVTVEDIETVVSLALRHRLRKDPLETIDSGDKVSQVFKEVFELEE